MKTPLCCVCRCDYGTDTKAVTAIKGYWVCSEHCSWDCDFFGRWEKQNDSHGNKSQLGGGMPYVAA